MKKLIVVVLILAMLVVSCGAKASNDPKEVAKQFVEASFKGDVETLKALVKKSELEELKATEDKFLMIKELNLTPEVTVDSLKEDGEMADAEVSVKVAIDGVESPEAQKMNIHLIIEDGKWVVEMAKSN